MNEREAETIPVEAERAGRAVRALERPVPDPAYRVHLGQAFASGTIARPGRAAAPAWLRPPVLHWVAAPLAAAAALLLVVVLNQGPRWELAAASGAGVAVVDGRPIPMNHTADLARALRPGAHVAIPAGTALELAAAGHMLIHFTPGSEFVVPKRPGRWIGRSVPVQLERGHMRIACVAAARPPTLMVHTPEAVVQVAGNTLTVICEPGGTCVCVLEGAAMAGHAADLMARIEPGRRRFFFNDGRAAEDDVMRPEEREALLEMRGRVLEGRI